MSHFQAETYVKLLTNLVPLPSKEIMFEELHEHEKRKFNQSPSKYFYTEGKLRDFFYELSNLGQVEPLPPVIFDIYDGNQKIARTVNHCKLKRRKIEIIDDFTYTDEYISDSDSE